MKRITVIGIGRLGGALAIALSHAGFRIEELVLRSRETFQLIASHFDELPAESKFDRKLTILETDLILIATPDPDISSIAEWLSVSGTNDAIVLHTSGALSSDVLVPLSKIGCAVGSMHPLISVSDPIAGSKSFAGSYFCVEGDPVAVVAANELILSLSAIPFSIPTDKKVLYHAAAVIACGHLAALIDIASELMNTAGVPVSDTPRILMPLIESTVANIKIDGTSAALTGSFARGDAEIVRKHLVALKLSARSDIIDLYRLLGERSLQLATERGVDLERIEAVRELLRSD